jgi:BMFP domain-containing protein YqiC
MAPITDQDAEVLKNRIHALEARIQQLEAKVEGTPESSPTSMRMILMGPPGAGMH